MFEETESFEPEVAEVITQRVNDACSKKDMVSKLKDLYEKYNTPATCKYLCVPKVNLELWHDLSKESKSKKNYGIMLPNPAFFYFSMFPPLVLLTTLA